MLARFMSAAVVACLIPLAGCGVTPTVKETRASMAEIDASDSIDVTTRNGSITVRKGDVDSVSISTTLRARTQERLADMRVVTLETPDGLAISVEPGGGAWRNSEGASFEIIVPAAAGVTLRAGNGSIRIEGLAGLADLHTTNGAIVVLDHDGPVKADTSNGKLQLERITGDVDATTSNGAVSAIDLHAGASIRTSNGRLTVQLADDAAGPVNLRTSNGAVRLDVGESFAGRLSATTSNGALHVDGGKNVDLQSLSKRRVMLVIGDSGAESHVTTSNGSLTIRLPG